eukprot:357881-Chlamydomonas_euryale.AAC.21
MASAACRRPWRSSVPSTCSSASGRWACSSTGHASARSLPNSSGKPKTRHGCRSPCSCLTTAAFARH